MHRTRIKICGIGHVEDALAAARAGADAIGLVFHPAAGRNVSQQRASEILAALPPFVTPVGLFVDAPVSRICEIAGALSIRHLQLHGDEPPELLAQLSQFVILKAVRVEAGSFAAELEKWRQAIYKMRLTNLHGLVLEAPGAFGGNGVPNDWEALRRHRQRGDLIGLPHLIAAGGLTPESVGAVIRELRPWAVDVSSGVESSPGRKSVQRIQSFVQAVRDADADQ